MAGNETGVAIGPAMKILLALALIFAILWVVSALLPRAFSQEALTYFSRGFLERAFRRANLSYLATGLQSIATFLVLFIFATRKFQNRVFLGMEVSKQVSPAASLWIGAVLAVQAGLLLSLASLAFHWYKGYYLEKAFGLTRLTLGGWFLEFLKGTALDLAIYAISGGFAAFLLVRFPRTWQYLLTIALFLGSIFFAYVYPTAIAPLFDRFTPLEDQAILAEVGELAGDAGMQVEKVLVMEASLKTSRANAYFTGIGKSKQVVLYDTLIANHSLEEVKLILAHELGHWKYGHIVSGIAFSAVGTLVITMLFSFVSGPLPERFSAATLRSVFLSLVLFSVLASYVATPIASMISRRHEVQADMFSLELTADPDSFVAAMIGLAKGNLGDVEPPWFIRWFAWTHPATVQRIAMGQQSQ